MRLQLKEGKGQRLLAVSRVHAGINWSLRRLSDGRSSTFARRSGVEFDGQCLTRRGQLDGPGVPTQRSRAMAREMKSSQTLGPMLKADDGKASSGPHSPEVKTSNMAGRRAQDGRAWSFGGVNFSNWYKVIMHRAAAERTRHSTCREVGSSSTKVEGAQSKSSWSGSRIRTDSIGRRGSRQAAVHG